jgi:hypothetical protein
VICAQRTLTLPVGPPCSSAGKCGWGKAHRSLIQFPSINGLFRPDLRSPRVSGWGIQGGMPSCSAVFAGTETPWAYPVKCEACLTGAALIRIKIAHL